jgi:hypothetical protein
MRLIQTWEEDPFDHLIIDPGEASAEIDTVM